MGKEILALVRHLARDVETVETGVEDGHTDNVGRLTRDMVARLPGLPELSPLWPEAASLHDVGKRRLPISILRKPGPLTLEERALMEHHTWYGHEMLMAFAKSADGSRAFWETAAEIALTHHENWNGSGYPQKLSGDGIPLAGRMVHIADVCSALMAPRAYHRALPLNEAVFFMASASFKGYFDPYLFEVFSAAMQVSRMEGSG